MRYPDKGDRDSAGVPAEKQSMVSLARETVRIRVALMLLE